MGEPARANVIVMTEDQLERFGRRVARLAVAEFVEHRGHLIGPAVDWIDDAAVAELTGYARATLRDLIRREVDPLPCTMVGRKRRYRRTEIEAWMLRQGRQRSRRR